MTLRQRQATAVTLLGFKWFCMLLLCILILVRINSSDWVYQESSLSNYFQSKNIMGSSKPEHRNQIFFFFILSTCSEFSCFGVISAIHLWIKQVTEHGVFCISLYFLLVMVFFWSRSITDQDADILWSHHTDVGMLTLYCSIWLKRGQC